MVNVKLLLCFLFSLMKGTDQIVLKDGGYEDVYIFVQETNEENEVLLKRIQEVFTQASELMFTATRQMTYFRKITIVIPKSWSLKPGYRKAPVPSPFKQYIVVDQDGIRTPHVRGLYNCGSEGVYMYLSAKDFLLKEGSTNWGLHDRVIVHEWGHLRWGLFDEYPPPGINEFYQADGKWNPIGCHANTGGQVGIGSQCKTGIEQCNTHETGKKMSEGCQFCPTPTQAVNVSLMSYQYLDKVSMFCDKDDDSVDKSQRHNRKGLNLQNIICKYKSAWEVMRTHKDFQGGITLPVSTNTTPVFEIVQSSEIYRVFVLDVSGSMRNEKLDTLRQTADYIIQEVIMQGSWLGIVTFSSAATTVRGLTQINTQSDRDALKAALPTSVDGSTCIGCGMEEAIKILKQKLRNVENTEIVVISDGLNNQGHIQNSTEVAVTEKVIVHTIAVTQQADTLLIDISQKTGGKHFTYLQTGSISFAASFSETITGELTSVQSQHIMLLSEKIDSTSSKLLQFNFTIEDGLGSNTSVTVITKSDQDISIELIGPDDSVKFLITSGTYATLLLPGVAMSGLYQAKISVQQTSQTIEYYVKSTPTSEDVVKITSWISASRLNFKSDESPAVFIDVRKGFRPVLNANTVARAETDISSCEFALMDNGRDPDNVADDGMYSAYIFPDCLRGGRVNVKAYVHGHAGITKSIGKVFGAPAIEEVDDVPEIFNQSFQRAQVLEELYVTDYVDPGSNDTVPPSQITDVDIYNIVSKREQFGESRNFTITWTAPGDDKAIGQATRYILRIADDLDVLVNSFDSADLLDMGNNTLSPQEAGMTEALKIVVDADQSYTKTAFFAVKAVDEAGNAGKVSNIVPIVVANGYRAAGENGSLEIVTVEDTEDVAEDTTDKNAIIGGTIGGFGLILICILGICFCRKRQRDQEMKGTDMHMGRV